MTDASSKNPDAGAGKLKVVLASSSPRRRELLEQAGVDFTVRIPREKADERLEPGDMAMPAEAAKRIAERKAAAVIQELLAEQPAVEGAYLVIGADTMVVLDGQIFGKPRNLEDAKRMLSELSGRTHEVITGVSLWMLVAEDAENVSIGHRTFADMSRVTFRDLTDDEIADYLRCGESFDKAGAYAIQGKGAQLVESREGALDNIIGLPVERMLREFPDMKNA